MAPNDYFELWNWLQGEKTGKLRFSVLWKVLLVRVADRVTDLVDEEGRGVGTRPYNYDLGLIAEEDSITVTPSDLQRVASYLAEHHFCKIGRRVPPKVTLTPEGMQEAERILEQAAEYESEGRQLWADGLDEDVHDWLLVHGYRGFDLGSPYSIDGMINFREIANHHKERVTNKKLESILSDLEFRDMIMCDRGPTPGKFWAYFNHGGEVAAKLLEEIWAMRGQLPASDRFVRLDDNSPRYEEAIASLERLVAEMREIRVNDWPEKEGMLASVKAAVEMIKTRYVNKTTILAAISSVTAFLIVKFVEAPISELANQAWTAIKNLF